MNRLWFALRLALVPLMFVFAMALVALLLLARKGRWSEVAYFLHMLADIAEERA